VKTCLKRQNARLHTWKPGKTHMLLLIGGWKVNNLSLRTLIMAGIGGVAWSLEKGLDAVEQLAARGEQAVNRGMELNRELRNRFAPPGRAQIDDAVRAAIAAVNPASKQEVQDLEARISRLEKQLL